MNDDIRKKRVDLANKMLNVKKNSGDDGGDGGDGGGAGAVPLPRRKVVKKEYETKTVAPTKPSDDSTKEHNEQVSATVSHYERLKHHLRFVDDYSTDDHSDDDDYQPC